MRASSLFRVKPAARASVSSRVTPLGDFFRYPTNGGLSVGYIGFEWCLPYSQSVGIGRFFCQFVFNCISIFTVLCYFLKFFNQFVSVGLSFYFVTCKLRQFCPHATQCNLTAMRSAAKLFVFSKRTIRYTVVCYTAVFSVVTKNGCVADQLYCSSLEFIFFFHLR